MIDQRGASNAKRYSAVATDRLGDVLAATAAVSALLVATLAPTTAHAALWRFEPGVSLQLRHDDNPRLNVANPKSVTTSVVRGSLAISSLTEIREVRGFLKADAFAYSGDDSDLNDHVNYLAGFTSDWKRPLTKWSFDGSLRRDTILSDIDIIENPGDVTIEPDDDVDDASVQRTVERDRLVLRPAWSHSLTELTGVRVAYRFNRVDYDPIAGTGLVEFEDHKLRGEYYRSVSERDEFAGSLELIEYEAPAANREYDGYSLEAVYRRKFDETTDGEVRAGVFRTDFQTSTDSGEEDGYLFGIEGSKRTGVTRYSARLRRTLFPAGAGDLVKTDEAILNVFHELSERSSISFRSRVFENRSLRPDNPDANRRYLSLEPRFRWRMTPEWFFDVSYRYQRQNRDTDPESADSNAVTLSFSYFGITPLD